MNKELTAKSVRFTDDQLARVEAAFAGRGKKLAPFLTTLIMEALDSRDDGERVDAEAERSDDTNGDTALENSDVMSRDVIARLIKCELFLMQIVDALMPDEEADMVIERVEKDLEIALER